MFLKAEVGDGGTAPAESKSEPVMNPALHHYGHLEEKVLLISMNIPGDDAFSPHSTQGTQVVSQAGKLERKEVPVRDVTWGCNNF